VDCVPFDLDLSVSRHGHKTILLDGNIYILGGLSIKDNKIGWTNTC